MRALPPMQRSAQCLRFTAVTRPCRRTDRVLWDAGAPSHPAGPSPFVPRVWGMRSSRQSAALIETVPREKPDALNRRTLGAPISPDQGSEPDALVPTGRLYGLPELPDGGCWVDTAGAAALTGVPPKTITSWLARGGPLRNPFPRPARILYRLYWPRAEVESWRAREQPGGQAQRRSGGGSDERMCRLPMA